MAEVRGEFKDGTAIVTEIEYPILVGGKDGSGNAQTFASGVTGNMQVDVISGSDSATPVITNVTGSGAISTSYAPSADFWLDSITLHLGAAPTTSENFTITLNANDGVAYDTVIQSIDLSVASTVDLLYQPDQPLLCESGDAIDVAYTNTDTGTFGLRIVTRLA